jgi:hypothetical protein
MRPKPHGNILNGDSDQGASQSVRNGPNTKLPVPYIR